MKVVVNHNEDESLFYVKIDGKLSKLEYKRNDENNVLDLHNTFVPVEHRGQHVGQTLVKSALEFAVANDYKVLPTCPFVRRVLDKYPKYQHCVL